MKTPICPILLFFDGDQYKCNPNKCNYDKFTKTCTMKCLKFQENYLYQKNSKKLFTNKNI